MAGASSGLEAAITADEQAPGYRERLEYSASLTAFEVRPFDFSGHGRDKKQSHDQKC